MELICKRCNEPFEYHRKKKFCSRPCSHPHKQLIKKVCAYTPCSKEFLGRPNKYHCSESCRTYHSHGNTHKPTGFARGKALLVGKSSPIYVKECPITKRLFTSKSIHQKYSPLVTKQQRKDYNYSKFLIYKRDNYIPVPKSIKQCSECGDTFKGTAFDKYCSTKCSKRVFKRSYHAKERMRNRAAKRESISVHKVFTKHNYHCVQCGVETPKELRGTILPNAPELDHIIPLSKGGVHDYINVQLLCRSCNGIKSDKVIDYEFV